MRGNKIVTIASFLLLGSIGAHAEMHNSSPDHFHFVITAQSDESPDILWSRLIEPAEWWHSAHTYSGDSKNMTLDLRAGGLWREDWEGGSVAHGKVLYAQAPKMLRLDAPFGPLQEKAVNAVWTISIAPIDGGSEVKFEFVANGSKYSDLGELAPAVEMVKAQALTSLVSADDE